MIVIPKAFEVYFQAYNDFLESYYIADCSKVRKTCRGTYCFKLTDII